MNRSTERLGKAMMVTGCVWYILAFFWLPPLVLLFGYLLPDRLGGALLRAEFVMSATLAAAGAIVWRRALGKPRASTYVLVVACASIAALGVFLLYGWI
jgi:hypothetical protein